MKWITTDWKGIVLGIAAVLLGIVAILCCVGEPFYVVWGSLWITAGLVQLMYIVYKKVK